MQLTIPREQLLGPLQWVNGVIQKKQTMPILGHVLISAAADHVTLIGTDTEVQLKGKMNLAQGINETGAVTVPAKKLLDICRSMPDDALLDFQTKDSTLYVRCGNSRFTLATLPEQDFPAFDMDDHGFSLQLPQGELARLIHRTHFAMAQEDVRQYLNGLLLEGEGQSLRAVATDGHRLAFDHMALETPLEQSFRIIAPYKAVMELSKVLKDEPEPLSFDIYDHAIGVKTDHFEFSSRLIDARYPDYQRVIPAKGTIQLNLDRLTFKQALGRAAILCNEKSRIVQLQLREGLMRVYAHNPNQEEAEEVIHLDYNGPELDIGFNVAYLLDVLNVMTSEHVIINIAQDQNGILIEAPDHPDSLFVVMAMQV